MIWIYTSCIKTKWMINDDAKNCQLNSSSIQMDEGVGFIQRQTFWFCSSLALQLMMQKVVSWTPCQYRWTKVLDSSRDEPTIRYKIEKKKYINVMCANEPPIIKLEWNSIEVSCKRIQLGNSYLFIYESCVYLWRFGLCGFYNPFLHCLNKYLHL